MQSALQFSFQTIWSPDLLALGSAANLLNGEVYCHKWLGVYEKKQPECLYSGV